MAQKSFDSIAWRHSLVVTMGMNDDRMRTIVTALVSSAATAVFLLKDRIFGKKQRRRVVRQIETAMRTDDCSQIDSPRFPLCQIGVIPARYASTRFPGKPLVPILGKPMIQRTYEQAKKVTIQLFQFGFACITILTSRQAKNLDKVIVATDDHEIEKACR